MRVRVCDLTKKRLDKKNPPLDHGVGVTVDGETFLVTVHRQVSGGNPERFEPAELSEEGLDTVLAVARYHARRIGSKGDLTPTYRRVLVRSARGRYCTDAHV